MSRKASPTSAVHFLSIVAQSQHACRNSVAVIVFKYPCQFVGVPMIINLGSRDADVVQPFRAVARECAKMTTFIIMVACLGFAAAAQVGPDRRGGESTDTSAMEETTGSTAGSKRATAELALSDEQRGRIYEGVMRIQDASVAYEPAPAVADALPSAVPLQDLPAGIAREIPPVQGHKFVKFDDRIVVVDPKSRVVVAMIPRYKLLP